MEQASGIFPLFPKQRSFDMLVDTREKHELIPITVAFFCVEGYQQQWHISQSYLGIINDKSDYLANIYWILKEGINSVPNQLFHHSPLTI